MNGMLSTIDLSHEISLSTTLHLLELCGESLIAKSRVIANIHVHFSLKWANVQSFLNFVTSLVRGMFELLVNEFQHSI